MVKKNNKGMKVNLTYVGFGLMVITIITMCALAPFFETQKVSCKDSRGAVIIGLECETIGLPPHLQIVMGLAPFVFIAGVLIVLWGLRGMLLQ
jgi:hypothetical protein